jgi:hypothetical protein
MQPQGFENCTKTIRRFPNLARQATSENGANYQRPETVLEGPAERAEQ